MGILEILKEKGINPETILNDNIKTLVKKIEMEFNTKVFDFGILIKNRDKKFQELLPLGFPISFKAFYMGYILVPIDDADNIITKDYYVKYKEVEDVDIHDSWNQFKMQEFANTLREDTEICDYIVNEFKGGNAYNIGATRVNNIKEFSTFIENIEKIEDVRFRHIFYFVDENLCTL